MNTNRAIGQNGEQKANQFLEQQGYQVLHLNYQAGKLELDIIALEKDILCFIEVKNYSWRSQCSIYDAISKKKKRYLAQAAKHFLFYHPEFAGFVSRFDAVFIFHEANGYERMELARNYFYP